MRTENIKLVALDLDDTTLKSDSSLAEETHAALMRAAESGIEIVVASGRAFTSLPGEILELEGVNYAITSNGSAVEKAKTGERIYSKPLPESVAEEILNRFSHAMFECFIEGQPYCLAKYMEDPVKYGCSAAYVSYVKTTRKPVEDMRSFMAENISRLDSIDIICPTAELKAEVYAAGKEIAGAYVTSSSPRLVEFASAEAGKGRALRWLCERLGEKAENVAAFGNGDNDADMLIFAGLGVAVQNATELCRASADYICETNDELGVAKTLYKIIKKEPVC
ncbi:MAG: HAD family hydrolase [Bacillota bacterium]|nr:HAD family hydrolase [Bacillota bacterium]